MELTVRQLIDKLKTCDQDAAVMVNKSNGGVTYLSDAKFVENKLVSRTGGGTAMVIGRKMSPSDEVVVVIT